MVVVGGGAHGLATAYYLAKDHGVKSVAVLEKSYIGAGGSGRNTTIVRSNYRTAGGRGLLLEERRAVRIPFAGARLQPHVLPARAPDARPFRPRRDHRPGARRGQPAARHREPRGRRSRGEAALPGDQHLAGRHLADRRRPLPPARRDHPPRRGRVGLRERSRQARRGDPSGHRGDRDRALERPGHGRPHEPRRHRLRHGRLLHGRLVDPDRRHGRGAAADLDEHPPGVRHRAGQAVPERGDRLVADARLHLADRPRRVPDGLRDRAVPDVLLEGDVRVHRGARDAHHRALPAAARHEDPPPVDGALAT